MNSSESQQKQTVVVQLTYEITFEEDFLAEDGIVDYDTVDYWHKHLTKLEVVSCECHQQS